MMTMCPSCFELYSEIWSKPCCGCGYKTVSVSIELLGVVKALINRGFKVSYANCNTHKDQDGSGKVTQMCIDLGADYPQALFDELPPDWIVTDSYPVVDNQILEPPFTVLNCVCEHPPSECAPESIDFAKEVTISNLELWLESKDPEACKAIFRLAGCD